MNENLMSEDDTFRKLKRPIFDDVSLEFKKWLRNIHDNDYELYSTLPFNVLDEFFINLGWTYDEYAAEELTRIMKQ